MLDCLPSPEEWSPESQLAFLRDHLHAIRHHLEAFESAGDDLAGMHTAIPHLMEINLRSHDAYDLLRLLATQTALKKREEC